MKCDGQTLENRQFMDI